VVYLFEFPTNPDHHVNRARFSGYRGNNRYFPTIT